MKIQLLNAEQILKIMVPDQAIFIIFLIKQVIKKTTYSCHRWQLNFWIVATYDTDKLIS